MINPTLIKVLGIILVLNIILEAISASIMTHYLLLPVAFILGLAANELDSIKLGSS